MPVLSTGNSFSAAEQITSEKLNNIANGADFTDTSGSAVDSSGTTGTCVNGGGLVVTTGGQLQVSDDGVTFAKMQNVAANSVLVRDANSEGDITAKALSSGQILIGDGTGFTAAALSGDATMTNAGAVTIKNNVALSGSPTTTTQSASDNSTKIATTAYVTTATSGLSNFAKFTDSTAQSGMSTSFTDRSFDSVSTASSDYFSLSSGKCKILISGMYVVMFRATFNVVSSSSGAQARIINESDSDNLVIDSGNIGTDGTHTFPNGVPSSSNPPDACVQYFDANDQLRLQTKSAHASNSITNLKMLVSYIHSPTF
jgi:hypothetical protein